MSASCTGSSELLTLLLAGDVMTGRGIDQILPHPGDDRIHEDHVKRASDYVGLAERANGPIHRPVAFDYLWGIALAEIARREVDARIVNLETAVTSCKAYEAKGINYKMNPANIGAITVAGISCCVLANNHVLDWGRSGLEETLSTLGQAGIASAGAGRSLAAAAAPAILRIGERARVLVFALASPCSGVPGHWAAAVSRPGVHLLSDLSARHAKRMADSILAVRMPRDVVVASIHWGGNWGHEVPDAQIAFAHHLIDSGAADVVHGHSSHHAKAIEVYRNKLILYGCGDCINDYEGIGGYEVFRGDLVLMYFPAVSAIDGTLSALEMVPMQIRNMRLNRVSAGDRAWLADTLNRACAAFGTQIVIAQDGALRLR